MFELPPTSHYQQTCEKLMALSPPSSAREIQETERQLVDSVRQAEALRAQSGEITAALALAKTEGDEQRRRAEAALTAEGQSRIEAGAASKEVVELVEKLASSPLVNE